MKKMLIMLMLPLLSLAQPDTAKAYIVGSKPLTAIRFFSDGTFIEHSYKKPPGQKEARIPTEAIDSGRYSEKRIGIVLKGRKPRLLRRVDKCLYRGLTRQKIRTAESSMYPTMKEWERMEWIRKNSELYIKQSQEYIKTKAIASIKKWCAQSTCCSSTAPTAARDATTRWQETRR